MICNSPDPTSLTAKVDALVDHIRNVQSAADAAIQELMLINSQAYSLADGDATPDALLEALEASSKIIKTNFRIDKKFSEIESITPKPSVGSVGSVRVIEL